MARVVNCPCEHALSGKDDNELFVLARQHANEHHPDSTRSEDEIRKLVTRIAQDA